MRLIWCPGWLRAGGYYIEVQRRHWRFNLLLIEGVIPEQSTALFNQSIMAILITRLKVVRDGRSRIPWEQPSTPPAIRRYPGFQWAGKLYRHKLDTRTRKSTLYWCNPIQSLKSLAKECITPHYTWCRLRQLKRRQSLKMASVRSHLM